MKYIFEVTEILKREVGIEADSEEEALAIGERLYRDGEIVLDADDFTCGDMEIRDFRENSWDDSIEFVSGD